MFTRILTALALALSAGTTSIPNHDGIRYRGGRKGMIVTSAILTTMSGKIGGAVASRARGGIQYFRKLVIPSNPESGEQTRVRANLTSIASAWRNTLTSVQRAAWTAIAPDQGSGIDAYTRANTVLMQGSTARQDTAPASAALPWTITPPTGDMVVAIVSGNLEISLSQIGTNYIAAPSRFSFYIQDRPQPASRQFPVGNLRYAGTIVSSGAAPKVTLTSIATNTQFPGLNGIADGNRVRLRVLAYNADGRVAGDVEAFVTVTAP